MLRGQCRHTGRQSPRDAVAAGLVDVDGESARVHVTSAAGAVCPPSAHEVDLVSGALESGHEGLEFSGDELRDTGDRAGAGVDRCERTAAATICSPAAVMASMAIPRMTT